MTKRATSIGKSGLLAVLTLIIIIAIVILLKMLT
jgi:hypothetical protein